MKTPPKKPYNQLIAWYDLNARALPWRETKDAYKIWLSEIILQQTRVDQGLPYYQRFVEAYPSVIDLSKASQQEVLLLWQGLGYYSRGRNLLETAQYVANELHGEFPKDYQGLLQLKGVGEYTAAAIASFAYREPVAVVDGNVIRVVSRLFGITSSVDERETLKAIKSHAQEILNLEHPDLHNQAMMELGSMICLPKKPICSECPFSTHCIAQKEGTIELIPLKLKKVKRRSRFFHYFVLSHKGNTLIRERNEKDIWQGLFEFPMLEKKDAQPMDPALIEQTFHIQIDRIKEVRPVSKHILSHQDIYAIFYHIEGTPLEHHSLLEIPISTIGEYALPRLIDKYLESHSI